MNFDPEMIKNMSPGELSEKLNTAARAMGVDPAALAKAIGDPSRLQKRLSEMSEADIRRLSSSLDPETQKKMNKILGEQYGAE